MPDDSAGDRLTDEIAGYIEAGVDAELPQFDDCALRLFDFQYENNEVFRHFCEAKGVEPADVASWQDVPLVYTDVFKDEFVASFPLERTVLGGLTSGTTSLTRRGRIFRDENGKRLVFEANRVMTGSYLFPDLAPGERMRILLLAPSPEMAPSMGMAIGLDQTRREFGTPESAFLVGKSGIDVRSLIRGLREAEASGEPVTIIGATSALVYFLQACRRDGRAFSLPPASRVCDGGGYHGRFGPVTRDEYFEMAAEVLGVPEEYCINTLGAAETATNLFHDTLRRHVLGLPPRERTRPVPPWSRVRAMSVDDLTPLPDGEVGLLAHWDLANVPTVLAVQTDNLGYTSHDGTCCEIVGRAKIEDGRVSTLPDEDRTVGPMGDKRVFRMLEAYTNFSIDLKTRFAKDPGKTEPPSG
jgi:hypothetical protein